MSVKNIWKIIFVIFVFFRKYVTPTVFLRDFYSNLTIESTAVNSLAMKWDNEDSLHKLINTSGSIPLISIDKPFGKFDPCDENSYSVENIQPLLNKINETTGYFVNSTDWVGLVESDDTVEVSCNGLVPIHLIYTPYAALEIQKLGAKGVVWLETRNNGRGASVSASEAYATPPGVDIERGEVHGTKVDIPVIGIDTLQWQEDGTVLDIGQSYFQWTILAPFSIDVSPYQEIIEPMGWYDIVWSIIGFLSFWICIFIGFCIRDVINFYQRKISDSPSNGKIQGVENVHKAAMQMRLLILVPEFVSTFVRMIYSYDGLGVLPGRFDHFTARLLFTFANSMSTFTDIATIMYLYDIYSIYGSSLKLRQGNLPFIVKYKKGFQIIVSFSLSVVVADSIFLYAALIGLLGSYIVIIPVAYVLCINSVFVIILLTIAYRMQRIVSKVLKNLRKTAQNSKIIASNPQKSKDSRNQASASKSKAAHSKFIKTNKTSELLMQRTSAFLKMQRFIVLAAVGRVVSIVAFALILSNWYYLSAFHFGGTLCTMGISSMITSVAQILAARQLPRNHDSESKVGVLPGTGEDHKNYNNNKNLPIPVIPVDNHDHDVNDIKELLDVPGATYTNVSSHVYTVTKYLK